MEKTMGGLLIIMFFLGAFQLIWAIIHPIVTKYSSVRKHFAFYWIGVFVYFGLLALMIEFVPRADSSNLFLAYFFTGAWGLALYHFGIIFSDGWHSKEIEEELKSKAENQAKPFEA